jgi:hypothetical protein
MGYGASRQSLTIHQRASASVMSSAQTSRLRRISTVSLSVAV